MSPSTLQQGDSDSEDDPDYVPASSDDDDEPAPEKVEPRSHGELERTEEQKAAEKKARDDLWTSFQASVAASSSSTQPESLSVPTVKIEKSYRFAGEVIKEVVEVPENSPEAKKWPLWRPPEQEDAKTPKVPRSESSTPAPELKPQCSSGTQPTSVSTAPTKRPGPRKPKTKLADIPSSSAQKAKLLSTLDKSAMDWKAHIESQVDLGVKEELEANRRSGGYLEKVEFLQRVEERREEVLETNKSAKRRRT